MSEESLSNIIKELVSKYQNNTTIFNKLIQHVEQLPDLLENTHTTIIEREKRKNKLESESELFIQKFLHNYKYYYNPSSELFFEYRDDNKYYVAKEDDVQHAILSTISANKTLMDWKHKLKVSILKKIKERDIFSCIPESETIQAVINRLYPSICDNREKAKYFLTVLGDVLLKKGNHTYFITSKTKSFLKELSNLSCMLFGSPNLFNIFKVKYYEHKYSDCRIIDTQEQINLENWTHYFKQNNALDLFCVAAHYSQRYDNADTFLSEHCKDESLKKYAFYLKDKDESQMIDIFYEQNIEKSEDCSISWKNMQYLWKHFIDAERLPNVFFSSTLKSKLIEKFNYDGHADVFLDCTSKILPTVSKFIQFWNESIDVLDDSVNSDDICGNVEELEIDELCSLFTHHTKSSITEKHVIDLIKHYYPEVTMEDDKYLLNTRCKLWNKKQDIIDFIKKYNFVNDNKSNDNKSNDNKSNDNKSNDNKSSIQDMYMEEIPINELYQYYCKCKNKFITSKRYFERFIKEESELYIIENNFIKVDSFKNI
jgi:hypothetical protein